MMKQKQQKENSPAHRQSPDLHPIPQMSPNSARRKPEFRLTRLQSEVMNRARSTISGLGDVWKSRVNGAAPGPNSPATPSTSSTHSTPPRSPKSANAVKNTFEFLWPRSRSKSRIPEGALKTKVKDTSKAAQKGQKKSTDRRQSRSLNRVDEKGRRLSRNQSVDISELQSRRHSRAEEFSRSLDDGMHYLSDDESMYNGRPKSYNETFNILNDYDDFTRSHYDYYDQQKYERSRPKTPTQRHILFNEEDDVIFYKTSPSPGKQKGAEAVPKPLPSSREIPSILSTRNSKNGASGQRNSDEESPKRPRDRQKEEPKVLSARLKIQPPSVNDLNNPPNRASPPQQRLHRVNTMPESLGNYQEQRSISTVIIEEHERDLRHYNGDSDDEHDRHRRGGDDQRQRSQQQQQQQQNRRLLNKQPSFDQSDFKGSTLPRTKKGAMQRVLEDFQAEEQLHRTGSLDLELEVKLIGLKCSENSS